VEDSLHQLVRLNERTAVFVSSLQVLMRIFAAALCNHKAWPFWFLLGTGYRCLNAVTKLPFEVPSCEERG
jgi:hypothetical protein